MAWVCTGYELCRKGMLSLVEQLSQLLNSGSSALLDTDERLTALNKGGTILRPTSFFLYGTFLLYRKLLGSDVAFESMDKLILKDKV